MRRTSYLITILLLVSFFALNPAMAFSQRVTAISAGASHCLALADDGSIWQWGSSIGCGSNGTLGGRDRFIPERVPIADVKAISAGPSHNLALKKDGTVWMWGQFPGSNEGTSTPVQIPITDVKAVYSYNSGGFAIKNDNTVWGWGGNEYGNIGDGTFIDRMTPVQVKISDVRDMNRGSGSCFAIKDDGTLWAWGSNVYDITENKTYTGCLGDTSSNESRPLPFMVDELTGIISVSSGNSHTLLLKNDGTVWAWGKNYYGQLGNGRTIGIFEYQNTPVKSDISDVKAISASGYQSMALKKDGTVWIWGIVSNSAECSKPALVQGLNDVVSISCGRYFFAALKSDGTVWAWGSNDKGQAGDGTKDNTKPSPVKVKLDLISQNTPAATPGASVTLNPAPTQAINDNEDAVAAPSQDYGWAFKLLGFAGLIALVGGALYVLRKR